MYMSSTACKFELKFVFGKGSKENYFIVNIIIPNVVALSRLLTNLICRSLFGHQSAQYIAFEENY